MTKSCPCHWTTPCHASCTCASPFLSGGCLRCCAYGSDDQRKAAAERLVIIEAVALRALRDHRAGDFQRTMPSSGYALIQLLDKLAGLSKP